MRANLGLSGSAFSQGRIMIEREIKSEKDQENKSENQLCPEEKDLKKLGLTSLLNAIAIPVFDKQSGQTIAVV
jgi:outer membrane phospholipase A